MNIRLYTIIALAALTATLSSCAPKTPEADSYLWGSTTTYSDFLWCRYTPDTLRQTLTFDFNDDARQYMTGMLQIALFEKDADGRLQRLPTSVATLYADGQPTDDNVISIRPPQSEVEVGVVFSHEAENRVHYWYLLPVDAADLDRINDREPSAYNDEPIMTVQAKKSSRINPLALGLLIAAIVLVAALLLWLLIIKPIVYPSFRVRTVRLTDPAPYFAMLNVKRYRRLVLTSKKPTQSWLSKLFTGEVSYHTNALWTADIVIEPKDKNSVRIRPDSSTYFVDSRILKKNEEYTIENTTTKTKTKIEIV